MTALDSLRGESSIFGSPYEIGVKNHHYLEFTGIYHETIIRTRIRCKKTPCRWRIVKKVKIF